MAEAEHLQGIEGMLERVLLLEKWDEPWRDLHGIAEHFACSERWIMGRVEESADSDDPLPCKKIAGKLKFKVSLVEPWMEKHGFIEQRNEAA